MGRSPLIAAEPRCTCGYRATYTTGSQQQCKSRDRELALVAAALASSLTRAALCSRPTFASLLAFLVALWACRLVLNLGPGPALSPARLHLDATGALLLLRFRQRD